MHVLLWCTFEAVYLLTRLFRARASCVRMLLFSQGSGFRPFSQFCSLSSNVKETVLFFAIILSAVCQLDQARCGVNHFVLLASVVTIGEVSGRACPASAAQNVGSRRIGRSLGIIVSASSGSVSASSDKLHSVGFPLCSLTRGSRAQWFEEVGGRYDRSLAAVDLEFTLVSNNGRFPWGMARPSRDPSRLPWP